MSNKLQGGKDYKKIFDMKISVLIAFSLAAAVAMMFPFPVRAVTAASPAQVIITFNNGTLSKPAACTTDLTSKLSVVDDNFAIVPNTSAAWNSGVNHSISR